jgi:hypothetical protein
MTPRDKPLPIRVPAELVARIDRVRGLIPRETYVRDLLDKAVSAQERKAAKQPTPKNAATSTRG